jgi:hypothetical protein
MRLYSSGVAIAARIAGDMRDAMKEAGNSRWTTFYKPQPDGAPVLIEHSYGASSISYCSVSASAGWDEWKGNRCSERVSWGETLTCHNITGHQHVFRKRTLLTEVGKSKVFGVALIMGLCWVL